MTRRVHLPQTMSAVRQTGQSEFGTKPKDNAKLHELKCLIRCAAARPRRAPRSRAAARRPACRRRRRARRTGRPCPPANLSPARTSRSPRCRPGARGGAVVDHAAHEQAVAVVESDRGAHPARHARRRERHAEPRPLGRLAAGELVDAPAQRGVGRQREDEAAVAADRVEADRLPARSTSGPPELPRGSGAVCSIEPATRRPRGPRKPRPVADTSPNVVRSPRPPGFASANTGVPLPGASPGSHAIAGASPVSTPMTATSRSGSVPSTRPSRTSPSKLTATSSPRSTCATVSTWPGAITTPEPRPQPRPSPTTAGPVFAAASVVARPIASRTSESLAICK